MYLDTQELAARWHLSVGTLQNYRWAKIGPRFIKPSKKRVLYLLEDIEAYERAHRVGW